MVAKMLSDRSVKYRLIDTAGSARTYIVIFQTGDEIATGLERFAEENALSGSSFKAVGALSYAKVAWFNWETKKYETAAEFEEQIEVLSLVGDVALQDGKPKVHAHLIVGRRDGTAHGGHLLEARVPNAGSCPHRVVTGIAEDEGPRIGAGADSALKLGRRFTAAKPPSGEPDRDQ
jgi:uncharacterized protein